MSSRSSPSKQWVSKVSPSQQESSKSSVQSKNDKRKCTTVATHAWQQGFLGILQWMDTHRESIHYHSRAASPEWIRRYPLKRKISCRMQYFKGTQKRKLSFFFFSPCTWNLNLYSGYIFTFTSASKSHSTSRILELELAVCVMTERQSSGLLWNQHGCDLNCNSLTDR